MELTTLVADEFNVDIIDFNGRIISSEKVITTAGSVATNIDISELAAGFYTLRISNDEGVQTEKVMMQR